MDGLLTVLFMEIITCSLKLEIKKKVYAVRLCDKNIFEVIQAQYIYCALYF